MQDAADATALAMAKQLGVATAAGITARAADYADGQLGKIATRDSVTVTTTISADNSSVTVAIDRHAPVVLRQPAAARRLAAAHPGDRLDARRTAAVRAELGDRRHGRHRWCRTPRC